MRTRALILAAIVSLAILVAPAAAQAKTTKHLVFQVTVSSTGTTLHSLPGDITYGWNHLVGPTTWGSRSAQLEFLGSVNYVDGSGPFGGLVTVTRKDGTQLAFSVDGQAMSPPTAGTEDTHFSGSVIVIGGSNNYAAATGIGTMTGFRKAALGSPVQLTFDLTVRQ